MKKIYIVFLLTGLSLSGCKKILDVNQDPNNPIDVQASLILPPAELAISDYLYTGNANITVQDFIQATAPNQANPGTWNYQLLNINFDSDWYNAYVVCMNNLQLLNKKAIASGNTNYSAIAKVLTAYSLGFTTDLWGDVPYTEAFNGTALLTPAYDKQEAIYKTMQSLLDDAIADINKAYAGKQEYYIYFLHFFSFRILTLIKSSV